MRKSKILITGASGCVGQYTADWLIKNSDAELLLWVRDPNKLTAIPKDHERVRLLVGDLRSPKTFAKELSSVNKVIHTATAWGDPNRAYQVNVKAVKELLNLLDPNIIEQIIYFSTASILDRNLTPLEGANLYGTEYIKTKALCLQQLERHVLAKKIIAIFPTLVFGGQIDGKSHFPTSYLTAGLSEACKWLWLARWFKAYSRFHFIHASDIAFVCGYLAINQPTLNSHGLLKKLVLAQPETSIDNAVDALCEWKGVKKTPKIPLKNWLVQLLIRILPIVMTDWDLFSVKQRHFTHDPITNPETFNGHSHARNLQQVFADAGLESKK